MMDFIYELYKSDNFVMILSIVLVVLVLLFVLVFIFGKKDQKLEETKRLQKLEMDTFKQEKKNDDVKLEVPVSESVVPVAPVEVRTESTPIEEVKPIGNEDANMVVFEPEEKPSIIPLEDEVENKIPVMPKPLFSDNEEEESPISINDLPVLNEEDKKMESGLNTLESIKNEFDKIEIPEVKDEPLIKEEASEKVFKPSPQIFSSVYVNKNEESVTKLDDEVVKPKDNDEVKMSIPEVNEEEVSNKLFTIEDDDDIELPTLKSDDKPILSDNLGETYELK